MLPLIPLALTLVPQLISLFAGDKAGAAAQTVAGVVRTVTGADDEAAAQAAINADPKMAAELKIELAKIVLQHEQEANREADAARQAELDGLRARLSDVENARQRDTDKTKAGQRNWRADAMLLVVGVGLLACIYAAAQTGVPPIAIGIISTVAGTLCGCIKDAFSFEFGSSRSSENKMGIIAEMGATMVPASMVPKAPGS
jgi:hypothetical protein